MNLSDQLTLSIVSHGHGHLLENLVGQLDANPKLKGVRLVVTLNQYEESFSFEGKTTSNLQLSIIRNPAPLGFGANHNQAFKRCETAWYAILNPDLSLTVDVFTPMIDAAIKRGASLTVPRVVNGSGVVEDSVRWNLTPWALMKRWLGIPGEPNLNDGRFRWFAGMFYLIESSVYRELGGFDEKYFLYCEDYDICARIYLAGYPVLFQPNVSVIHDARRTSWKSRKYLFMHMKSILRVWSSTPVWRIAFQNMIRPRRVEGAR